MAGVRNSRILLSVVNLIVSLIFLFWLASFISVSDVLKAISEVSKDYLYGFLALSLVGIVARARRFQVLLETGGSNISLFLLCCITVVRNFCSDLLPARLGTTVYMLLVVKFGGASWSLATSSFATTFLADIVVIFPLLVGLLLFAPTPFGSIGLSYVLAALFISFIAGCLFFLFPKILSRLGKTIFKNRFASFANSLVDEFNTYRGKNIFIRLLILSCILRICKYGSYLLFLKGVLVGLGYSSDSAGVVESILGFLAAEVSASLPISGFLGFGAYEGAWTTVLTLTGFPLELAALTGTAHHIFTQAYGAFVAIAGVFLLWVFRTKINQFYLKESQKSMLDFAIVSATFFVILITNNITGSTIKAENFYQKPATPVSIVFDSNRSGTFGIYKLIKGTNRIEKVVDTELQEMYPDAKPDGTSLVYASAKTTSRYSASDIWIVDVSGKNSKLLVSNGSFPSFVNGGKAVLFERKRKQIVSYNIVEQKETLLFPITKEHKKNFKEVVKPRLSPDQKLLAFIADYPSKWHSWVYDISSQKLTSLGSGCEPNWLSNSKELSFIKRKSAKAGSGIYVKAYDKEIDEVLQDLPDPFGHEYFPTVTENSKYLLYSASPGSQHSHLTSNYQIFVKDMQTSEVIRVTYDSFTNRWPRQLLN